MADVPDAPEFGPDDRDGQDMAEMWDEDNLAPDTLRMRGLDDQLTFDTMPEVYDTTRRVGDEDDDEALIADELDDDEIVELSVDGDAVDLEDDPYVRRDEVGFHLQDADEEPSEEEAEEALMAATSEDVELEDAGDLNDAAHAMGSAKRYESARVSDEELERLGYGEGRRAADTDDPRSFDPADGRTAEEREKHARQDELLDEGVEETIPASDPVSVKHIT